MWVTVTGRARPQGVRRRTALTDKGDGLWGKASGRAGRVQRRRMRQTFVSKIFILLPPKQKEERRHKPKLFGNNCLLFTN